MKVSNLLASAAILTTLFAFPACNKDLKNLNEGTFTGQGSGRNGIIEVSITVHDGKIAEAHVVRDQETPEIAEFAKNQILSQFIEDGSTANLDVVSGATMTSNGLLDALDAAVASAQGQTQSEITYHDSECDIAIIGAGGAGLTAATEAASKGANVIVLEKMGIVGGNSNFSTGGINAAYTKEQERLGIIDSKKTFFEDTMKGGKFLNNPELVKKLVDESAGIVEWLQSPMIGADLSDVGIFGGATNKRIHRPQGGGAIGAHLVPLLHKAAITQGADIRLNNRVIDIISENGKPAGVLVSHNDKTYTVKAKAIIIATGGFGANSELVQLYQPSLAGFSTTNHKGATGDAFKMVEKFNAALTQMEQIQTHPTVVKGTGFMITEAVRGNGAILVNRNGKRFVNEMETRDIVSSAILKSPGKSVFLLFDQGITDSLKAISDYIKQPWMVTGSSVQELAKKLKINPDELEQTIQLYNHYVSEHEDADFERNAGSMERRIEKAPFYAIEIEPAVHHTMGGLKINTEAQVLDKNDKVIPGLFAAGEVTGGIHGANRLGGNAVADICIFGKIAADSALKFTGVAK